MPKKTALENVAISYDPLDGAIRLTSRDPRLRGKPFQLTVTANSQSYASLIELIEEKSPEAVDRSKLSSFIDDLAVQDTNSLYTSTNADARRSLQLGRKYTGEALILNLMETPHCLVSGLPGSGKSVLLRNVLFHALTHENIVVHTMDSTRGYPGYRSTYTLRGDDSAAGGLLEFFRILVNLENELSSRRRRLHRDHVDHYLELNTALPAHFLIVEELGHIDRDSTTSELSEAIGKSLTTLLQYGPAVGIHLFMGAQDSTIAFLEKGLKPSLQARFLMGAADSRQALSMFGEASKYGSELLSSGMGVTKLPDGKQELFGAFHITEDQLEGIPRAFHPHNF